MRSPVLLAALPVLGGVLLASDLHVAAARDPACVARCRAQRQTCGKDRRDETNCTAGYDGCRKSCVTYAAAGPARRACLSRCRGDRKECRGELAACVADCGSTFRRECVPGCG